MTKILSKRDINKAAVTWWLTSHLTYNYQRLQAGALSTVLGPILNKLYKNDNEKISAALKRHMLYFNTEPRIGAVIPGMVIALEESLVSDNEDEIYPEMITDIKTALMGPVAGIGDTLFAGLLKPIFLSIALGWATMGYIAGAFLFGFGFLFIDFVLTYTMFHQGYKLGLNCIDKFMDQKLINLIRTFLGIVGLFCLGAMIVKYISIKAILEIPLTMGVLSFDSLLNKILPSALPVGFTMFAFWLQLKGKSILSILIILFVIGFIGGALGLLG